MQPFINKKLLQYCTTAILPFCLTGCMGIYEGGFECPPGTGVGCKSISEVNDMVNQREIPKTPASPSSTSTCEKCSSEDPSIGNNEENKIWVAPWVMVEA